MAYKFGNRVKETVSGTPGTGTITLGGAVAGFTAFSSALSNTDTCPYVIEDATSWELGVGTYTSSGNTLARTTVIASSAGGTTKISATSQAVVYLAPSATDLAYLSYTTSGSGTQFALTTSPTFTTPVLGTPTSGTLTNCTGYTVSNLSGAGTNVTTFLATPSSANLASAITDETGSGSLVFGTNPTITNYTEAVVAIGNSGTSKTLDLTNGTVQTVTMTGNCTFTMPTVAAGKSFVLIVSSGAGSFTGTFTSVKWPSNTAPTLTTTASRWDILSFFSDGTNWYGSFVQGFQ